MDFEKEYKEARARAIKAIAKCRPLSTEANLAVSYALAFVFPDTTEIEDEKVRNALIEHFKWNAQQILNDFDNKEVLAWLEKQGENNTDKIIERARTEKQRVLLTETDGSANIDWDCRSLDDVKLLLEYGLDYIKILEEQGKQKSQRIISAEAKEAMYGKPAWSEDDEEHLKDCILALQEYRTDCIKKYGKDPAWADCVDWLKSLKDRYTWKPSSEQMEYLSAAIEESNENPVLESLYNDLKKL